MPSMAEAIAQWEARQEDRASVYDYGKGYRPAKPYVAFSKAVILAVKGKPDNKPDSHNKGGKHGNNADSR